MIYYTKISEDRYGTLFESPKQQENFLGAIESGPHSGPYFEHMLPYIDGNEKMAFVSKFFKSKNEEFEVLKRKNKEIEDRELRKLYEDREIKQLYFKDLEKAEKKGKENRKDDESKILRKTYKGILKMCKDINPSKHARLNDKHGSSISFEKASKAFEITKNTKVEKNHENKEKADENELILFYLNGK
jgi:hypothetical protein